VVQGPKCRHDRRLKQHLRRKAGQLTPAAIGWMTPSGVNGNTSPNLRGTRSGNSISGSWEQTGHSLRHSVAREPVASDRCPRHASQVCVCGCVQRRSGASV